VTTQLLLSDLVVSSIERATLKAVRPALLKELPGWLVPIDHGQVGRAHSAAALSHNEWSALDIAAIENIYHDAGLAPKFRLPVGVASEPMVRSLEARGYQASDFTWVKIARVDEVLDQFKFQMVAFATRRMSLAGRFNVEAALAPGFDWQPLYGSDDAGRSRLQVMQRCESARFFSIQYVSTVASGMAAFDEGWVSVHGMRTDLQFRRLGLASQLINAMLYHAQERKIEQAFLQVEANNTGAIEAYRRLGFRPAWQYAYWSRQD
jgi:N-acetylglutamate synthase